MKRLNISLIALASALAVPAQAQVIELDDIVVTANRTETEKAKVGASVSTVSAAGMTGAMGARGTAVLDRLPGVALRTLGPIGTQAGLTIRGVPHTNIIVRVDGIDVTDPSGTQVSYDFGRLSFGDVSRLELARGAQSALYGSRANGGVISMTTRRATEEGVSQEAAIEAGSYRTLGLSYGLAMKSGPSDVAFTLSHYETAGFSAADETNGNTEPDGYRADRISFAAGYEFASGLSFYINGFYDDSAMEYDSAFSSPPTDSADREDRIQKGLRVAASFDTGAINHELEAAYFDSDRKLEPFVLNFRGTRKTFGYKGAADISGFGTLVIGLERSQERYYQADTTGSVDFRTNTKGLYAELATAPTDAVDIVASARVDDHSQFGNHVTGRVSTNWRINEDITFKGNLGNGFRAPSNYELFAPSYVYDGVTYNVGNPSLQPETSVNFDLGIEKRFGDQGMVAATLFAVEAKDLIDYSYATSSYVQVPGKVRRQGLELEGSWTFDNGVTVDGNYTYTDSKTAVALDSSSWLANSPRHQLTLGLATEIGSGWRGIVSASHAAGRVGLADYTTVDVGLSKELGEGREAYLRIENLFDEDYQSVPGYGTAGRSAFVGLRAKF